MLIRPHKPNGGPLAAIAFALTAATWSMAAQASPTATPTAAPTAARLRAAGAQEAAHPAPAEDEAARYFEANVRPILIEHCVTCHSGEKPKGGLILDSVEGIRAGVGGEPIFAADAPEESLIVEAIRYDDPFIAMPPSGPIPKDDVAAIEKWIELGATLPAKLEIDPEARVRWCFQPPMPPSVEWAPGQDPIDALIERELELAGIEPADEAERPAWLRRVTFDLTGLPPSPGDIASFVSDDTPGAFEKVVDRLLASPAYGERQARRWLDLMRYAETKAHEFDYPILNAWEYRDYVIRAFDADVPYDRLVTELLAGDLVEEPRLDPTATYDVSPLGTGAWFLGDEVHSPVTPRGDQADRVAHQVEVLSKSIMALGVSCARCHDHKFDPISAEDYHALAGFALSTAPRQLRYETDAANREVAEGFRWLEDAAQRTARRAIAASLEEIAEGVDVQLAAAIHSQSHFDREAEDLAAPAPKGKQEGKPEGAPEADPAIDRSVDLAGFDAWAQQKLGAPMPSLDLAIESFESGSYAGAVLGDWEATGDAFGTGPLHRKDIAKGELAMIPRGDYVVSTYGRHPGKDKPSNKYTGTLTSPPFPMVRPYLHFLINGGSQEGARVELVDAASGDLIGKVHGARTNAFRAVTIHGEPPEGPLERPLDGPQEPRLVRIRIVDEDEGDWGQVGADQFVLSSSKDPEPALTKARSPGDWARILSRLKGGPGGALQLEWYFAWKSAVDGDPRHREALSALFQETYAAEEEGPTRGSTLGPAEAFVDYGALGGKRWIPSGPTFGTGPIPEGHVTLAPTGGESIDISVSTRPAARAHRAWDDLRVHPDSSTGRGSSLRWVQAGRTLVTPGGTSRTGRFAHLMRGKAKVIAPIASHKLVAGPLHGDSIKTFDTAGVWRWVEHRMPSAKGHHVHFEWTAMVGSDLEIARTVELDGDDPLPALDPTHWIAEWAQGEGFETETVEQRARLFGVLLRDAAELLRRGGIQGRILNDDARAGLLGLADFVVHEISPAAASVAAKLSHEAKDLNRLAGLRQLESRLAPAALDLEGRDERILARGDWQQPTARAPRGAPKILRPSAENAEGATIPDGSGSGRLRLARSLLASDSKIVQRVWVNRLWQSMFGRGIVATTDDFGEMGALPSHPALLDHLAIALEQGGWSTKAMLRRMALSQAYRRQTAPSTSAAELDPTNALLSHMSVRRLQAEEVRDALLSVSAELVPERFGRPVPIHLTPFMDGRGKPGKSGPLDGAGRRSIYIETRRNFPHPFLTVFDLPAPSTCHGTRTSANVPAQALAMLNDPFVEDRAVAFAESVAGEAVDIEALNTMWIRALGRPPRPAEAEFALQAVQGADDPKSAKIDIAHVLFNTKEFIFLR